MTARVWLVGGQWVEPMLRAILVIVVGIWFWSEAENDLGCVNVSRRCGCVLSLRVRVGVGSIEPTFEYLVHLPLILCQ